VSPASTPDETFVEETATYVENLGLKVELGDHVFDRFGFLAGKDVDRLADLNDALRDPGIKAIVATRGGKGAYRIAAQLDFAAARAHPKLLIGFSEITILHMALYKYCGLAGIHGAPWIDRFNAASAASFRQAVFSNDQTLITTMPAEPTAQLTTKGRATGVLLGGNQDMVTTAAGWILPVLSGAILLLEAFGLRLGQIDRQLTMLKNAGHLDGIVGVVVGQYTDCGSDATTQGDWTAIDVLRGQLQSLGVPILGGLPIGHGERPMVVPIGTMATLDCEAGTLVVESAVE
jgi:muramoyltetrapeptide carboxypeptidase